MSSIDLLLLLSEAGYGFFCVILTCELGQRVSNAFYELSIRIDQFGWYLFPMEIKRILPMITVVAQEPVTFECFGSIALSRDTFKRVKSKKCVQFLSMF